LEVNLELSIALIEESIEVRFIVFPEVWKSELRI